jgi:hypothetical protein
MGAMRRTATDHGDVNRSGSDPTREVQEYSNSNSRATASENGAIQTNTSLFIEEVDIAGLEQVRSSSYRRRSFFI